ncbi:hypothetical protein ES703_05402 [subsurface metagenome]
MEIERKRARKRVNRRWKLAETWWWKQTGWKRLGHIRRGVSCADLSSPMFSLDVTTMKKMPAKIEKEMLDAEYHAQSTQTAIVAMHAEGEDMKRGVVMMRVSEFLALHSGKKG